MGKHIPVLLGETISSLNIQKKGVYVDCTFGSGGHSGQILRMLGGSGKLISFDWDHSNLQWVKQFSANNFFFINDSFANLSLHLDNLGVEKVNGFLFDLGLSSMQLDNGRGFSYRCQSPLDMRMDGSGSVTAADILNNSSLSELADIFYNFGQERKAYKVARVLLSYRKKKRIENSQELVRIVTNVIGKQKGKGHPAKKVFQALRIKVNKELENLQIALDSSLDYLSENGRIVVISYHSLEDRIVKRFFQYKAREGFLLLHKKPLLPTAEEVTRNNRSRSAKLRVLTKDSGKITDQS